MGKIFSMIKNSPKRVTASAIFAAAILVPATLFAWGPARDTYTVDNPATKITFNSITDNPVAGDERNFVVVKDAANTNDGGWTDNMTVQEGKEYLVRVFVHNNAASSLNLVATNTRVSVSVPTTTGKNVSISGFVSADNSDPQRVWDDIHFNSADKNFNLAYVAGSARIYNNGYASGANGQSLPDSIVTSAGALIGYEGPDGRVPGCFEYASWVYFKVKPQFGPDNFTVDKEVRKAGDSTFVESVNVKSGDKLDYRIVYKNTGANEAKDVILKDKLPKGVSFVPGSVKILNANNPSGAYVQDGDKLFSTGINIGDYTSGSNAIVIYKATVSETVSELECGKNTLTNVASAKPKDQNEKQDTAEVVVPQECKPPVTPPELPKTGAGEAILSVLGAGSLVASLGYYIASRRQLGLK